MNNEWILMMGYYDDDDGDHGNHDDDDYDDGDDDGDYYDLLNEY